MNTLNRTPDGLAFETVGKGPPLLLVHEGIADRRMWDPQWEDWRDRFRLVRYDQRGFGDSADPDGPYSRHGDAASVLDAAEINRATVIGASMGGAAALDLALFAPHRVSALVLVGTTPSGWEHAPDLTAAFDTVEAAYEQDGLEAANEVELRMWVDGPGREPGGSEPEVRAKVAKMNLAALQREERQEQEGGEIGASELDPPAVGRLHEIEVPTLVVTGACDQPSVNAGAAAIASGVSEAEAVEIAATAHVPNLERPAEFEAAVLGFFERNGARI